MKRPVQTVLEGMPPEAPKKRKLVKLAAFKKTYAIGSHDAGANFDPKEARWLAIKIPAKRLDNGQPLDGMTLGDMIATFGRLLEEGNYTGEGPTEQAAIADLCSKREIPPP